MIAARSLLRRSNPRALRAAFSTGPAFDTFRDHLMELRLTHSKEPQPYSSEIPIFPVDIDNIGDEHKKVAIVGCGQVGMAIAFAILNQVTAGTIALVDMNAERLDGEAKDLAQGSAFHQHVRIEAGSDYAVSANSHLVIVTAGVAQQVGESRLALIERNVQIMQSVIPAILAHSPNAAICIVSNPCDIMTAVANKIAGPSVPPGRIFGSGTCLDSSRLQSLLGKGLNIDAQAVSGYVIGEHGDSSVAAWSSVRIGGVPIILEPGGPPSDMLKAMHREVVDSAGDVIVKKGYTNWAVGLTGAYIGNAVLDDTLQIMPLSTCVRGFHGITEDVFLSMPCSVGSHGVRRVIDLPLTQYEIDGFLKSAETVWEIQQGVWDSI